MLHLTYKFTQREYLICSRPPPPKRRSPPPPRRRPSPTPRPTYTPAPTPDPTPMPTPAPTPSPTPPPPPAEKCTSGGYSMLFEDNFDFLDTAKWSYQLYDGWQYGVGNWGNDQYEWLTNSTNNVYTQDGNLVIKARYEPDPTAIFNDCWAECKDRCGRLGYIPGTLEFQYCVEPCGWPRCDYIKQRAITSGRIRSYKKFSVAPSAQYGSIRIEGKIKLPAGPGLWPAFWMLPEAGATDSCSGCGVYGNWPTSGEIDIMEAVNNMWVIIGSLHYGGEGAREFVSYYGASNNPEGWHTFAIEWQASTITWFVDGVQYGTSVSKASTGGASGWFSNAAPGTNAPFDQPFHLVLNLAAGGNLPSGDYARNNGGATLDLGMVQNTLKPDGKSMLVDWVRVCGK